MAREPSTRSIVLSGQAKAVPLDPPDWLPLSDATSANRLLPGTPKELLICW